MKKVFWTNFYEDGYSHGYPSKKEADQDHAFFQDSSVDNPKRIGGKARKVVLEVGQ